MVADERDLPVGLVRGAVDPGARLAPEAADLVRRWGAEAAAEVLVLEAVEREPSLQRTARLRKNQDLLRSLRSQHGARLRLRAERGPSPQELVKQASLAARLQDLDIIRLEAGIERREPAQWDELRVWDPGDG